MKTIRVAFAAFAITIASSAVYASTLVVTTFWRSAGTVSAVPSTANPDCSVQLPNAQCPTESGQICTIPADSEGNLYIVSKKVTTPCVLAYKAI